MSKNTKDFFKKKKEWSKVKDEILACYLKPYFTKIQYTKKKIIYIDGFAGVGIFEDGTLGSPLIAYNIAKEVGTELNIELIFIEQKFSNELSNNVKNYNNCCVISGNYEDNIVDLINKNEGNNIFVYVDPFGIKNINFSYFEKLNSSSLNSAEFLMNLNSFGFIREGCRLLKADLHDVQVDEEFEEFMDENQEFKKTNTIEHMNSIAGGDYWQEIIQEHRDGKINGYEAEKRFVELYCTKMKEFGKFKYVINIPIRTKAGSPPKYRMVYATNHADGVILMNDNMCKRFDELLNIQTGGSGSLFQENSENEIIDFNKVQSNLLSLLDTKYINYFDLIATYIDHFGIIKTKYLNEQLRSLESERKIIITRIPPTTSTGKASKFLSPGKNQKTLIRLEVS